MKIHVVVYLSVCCLVLFFISNIYFEDKKNLTAQNRISPDQAKIIALNDLKLTKEGVELNHPSHQVAFTENKLSFQPKKGPQWDWQLTHIGTDKESICEVNLDSVKPKINKQNVEYDLGQGIVEQYRIKLNSIEQCFVIKKPLVDLHNQDLVIKGNVESEGEFSNLKSGWHWKDESGAVFLGDVTVFDNKGKILKATMTVTSMSTKIIVDGDDLLYASYPVTVDPEIGANDFRISDIGLDGDPNFDASFPDIAYNSRDNEYLVVWSGVLNISGLLVDLEIFGQRIDASTGNEIGANDFRISDMGIESLPFQARLPSVSYNSKDNEYLVVWEGNDATPPLANDEFEIFGQRLDALGNELGINDFRISDMGPDGNPNFNASIPAVDYNSEDNEYLVVWSGDDNTNFLVDEECEIFGQRLDALGNELGINDFRISDMGPDGNPIFDASIPAVAYNSIDNEFLVVWDGALNATGTNINVSAELEIFGQRLDALGNELGTNDFRISDMGTDGNLTFDSSQPSLAYNSKDNEYLVVWQGNDDTPLANGEFEIFGQRLAYIGTQLVEVGINDFRISNNGPDGDPSFQSFNPSTVYNSENNEYLVTWASSSQIFSTFLPLAVETEIFGQRLDAEGKEIGVNDFRISEMGPDGDLNFNAMFPAVAYNKDDNENLITWSGTLDAFGPLNEELEIFGQFFVAFLSSDIDQLPASTGGTQNLFINAGKKFAGSPFLLLGSFAGTSPGQTVGNFTLPLSPDAYFIFTLTNTNSSVLSNNFGTLDSDGKANIQFNAPANANLAGLEVNHAAIIFDSLGNALAVTDPINVTFTQ